MWNSGHDAYLESRVLTADPIELVNLLYRACTEAVLEARRHLAEGRIAELSRQINQACAILIELAASLDHERGGEISQRLALLYDYMQRRLLEANMQQADAPLADVLGLLATLSEAWVAVQKHEEKPAADSQRTQQPVAESGRYSPRRRAPGRNNPRRNACGRHSPRWRAPGRSRSCRRSTTTACGRSASD